MSKHCQVSEPVRPLAARLDIPAVKLDPFAHDSANDVLPAPFYRDGDLRVPAAHSLALPGGVYYLRNLVVSAGARLRLNGPVTFLVSGEVNVEGAIETIGARPAQQRKRERLTAVPGSPQVRRTRGRSARERQQAFETRHYLNVVGGRSECSRR